MGSVASPGRKRGQPIESWGDKCQGCRKRERHRTGVESDVFAEGSSLEGEKNLSEADEKAGARGVASEDDVSGRHRFMKGPWRRVKES